MKFIGGLCLAGCLLLTSACHREKPRPLSPPPPPQPVQKSESDIKLDAPPKVEPKTAATEVLPLPAEVQDLPPPPPEPKPQKRRRSTAPPAKTTPTQGEEETENQVANDQTVPAVELPKLGEVLSTDQQKEYRRTINDSIKRARRNLAIVRRHALSEDQTNTVGQVESLILQADKTQDSDLTSAKSLAERADLLAQDLAKGFK